MLETIAISAANEIQAAAAPRAASPLRTIEAGDRDAAIKLLMRGFPQTGEAFWRRNLDRQIAVQGGSLGYFLDGKEGPVGLMLMLRSQRRMATGASSRSPTSRAGTSTRVIAAGPCRCSASWRRTGRWSSRR